MIAHREIAGDLNRKKDQAWTKCSGSSCVWKGRGDAVKRKWSTIFHTYVFTAIFPPSPINRSPLVLRNSPSLARSSTRRAPILSAKRLFGDLWELGSCARSQDSRNARVQLAERPSSSLQNLEKSTIADGYRRFQGFAIQIVDIYY